MGLALHEMEVINWADLTDAENEVIAALSKLETELELKGKRSYSGKILNFNITWSKI